MRSDKKREHICSQVSRILREERKKRGLSMTALAARSGLAQQAVSYVEREMRVPNLDTLLRLAEGLTMNLSEIIKKAEKSP